MLQQPGTNKPIHDRWAYLWLGLGLLFAFFSIGQWVIPLAAWLAPVFTLRFLRTQPVVRGFTLVALTSMIVIPVAANGLTPFPFPVSMGFMAVQVLLGSLPLLADRLLAPRLGGLRSTLVFPLAATAWEFINLISSPMGSFGSTAYTQYGNLALMQLVSLTGIWGLTFLINWFAGVTVWAWEQEFTWPRIRAGVLLYGSVLALVLVYGYSRLLFAPIATASVRMTGINAATHGLAELMPLWETDRAAFRELTQANHARYLAATVQEARTGAQVVVWPEGAGVGTEEDVAALIADGQALAQQEGIYLAMPVFILYEDDARPAENRLLISDPTGVLVLDHVKYGGNFLEGTLAGDGVLRTAETPFGLLNGVICWDADFVGNMRQVGRSGSDLLIVPARDWPGVAATHAQMAVFRAIENGVALFRVTDEGLSLAADPYGHVLAVQDYYTTTNRTLVAQVPVQAHAFTLYALIGDLVGWLSVAGFALILVWVLLRNRLTRAAQVQSATLPVSA
jgi:apolipoprotein N-acyltransferase